MRYEVPQFIEIEDKIIGPFSIWQFIYLAGGAGFAVVVWLSPMPKILSIILAVPVILLALSLAFYKVNERPFILFLEALFNYYVKSKLYIWKKRDKQIQPQEKSLEEEAQEILGERQASYVPKMSDSKLKDLTWALDIEDRNGEVI